MSGASFITLIVVLVAVFAIGAALIGRKRPERAAPSRPRASPAAHPRPAPTAANPKPAAQPLSAPSLAFRWRIVYHDLDGTETRREIHFDKIQPMRRSVDAWCSLRQAERTFLLDRCAEILDMHTGRYVDDIDEWLRSYRRWRRREGPKP